MSATWLLCVGAPPAAPPPPPAGVRVHGTVPCRGTVKADGTVADVRTPFARPVEKEQDAVSQLTLLAQQLWENSQQGKAYKPQPTAAPASA